MRSQRVSSLIPNPAVGHKAPSQSATHPFVWMHMVHGRRSNPVKKEPMDYMQTHHAPHVSPTSAQFFPTCPVFRPAIAHHINTLCPAVLKITIFPLSFLKMTHPCPFPPPFPTLSLFLNSVPARFWRYKFLSLAAGSTCQAGPLGSQSLASQPAAHLLGCTCPLNQAIRPPF